MNNGCMTETIIACRKLDMIFHYVGVTRLMIFGQTNRKMIIDLILFVSL